MKRSIEITLNGEKRAVEVEPNDTLLEVLREKMGAKGPKVGCDRGDCGTCNVLLDGMSVRSCLILAIETDGSEIVSIEGLCPDGPGPLQDVFVKNNAFQCGFCAPGITVSAMELLNNNPEPTREDVVEAISGNLCRCTGYTPIIDSILEVSKKEKSR